MNNQLVGHAVSTVQLTDQEKTAMFELFRENYDRVSFQYFLRDLSNKNWVVLLRDSLSSGIKGFSTLAFYSTKFEGKRIGVVYSGDTIIDRAFWGTPELPKVWIRTVMEVGKDYPEPLYWFLISSGYKTYRFLTVFFIEYYPCGRAQTPEDVQRLMDHLAVERFGEEYDPAAGVVRFKTGATPLKEGVAAIDENRIKSPDIRYFLQKNPGHIKGDELVCLTLLHPDNFSAAGKRMLR
jgi:hypothetical protein